MLTGKILKVKFRTGNVDLNERRKRCRKIHEDDDDVFKCNCGCACEDQMHTVRKCPICEKEKELYMGELGKIKG